MKTMRLMFAVLTVFLSACTYVTEPTQQVDTTPKVVLPPFAGMGDYIFTPSQQEYEVQLWFYGPPGFRVEATATSDNQSVAQVTSTALSANTSLDDTQIRWLVGVRFKVTGVGRSKVTLKLTNVPGQSTSFTVLGVSNGGKG